MPNDTRSARRVVEASWAAASRRHTRTLASSRTTRVSSPSAARAMRSPGRAARGDRTPAANPPGPAGSKAVGRLHRAARWHCRLPAHPVKKLLEDPVRMRSCRGSLTEWWRSLLTGYVPRLTTRLQTGYVSARQRPTRALHSAQARPRASRARSPAASTAPKGSFLPFGAHDDRPEDCRAR